MATWVRESSQCRSADPPLTSARRSQDWRSPPAASIARTSSAVLLGAHHYALSRISRHATTRLLAIALVPVALRAAVAAAWVHLAPSSASSPLVSHGPRSRRSWVIAACEVVRTFSLVATSRLNPVWVWASTDVRPLPLLLDPLLVQRADPPRPPAALHPAPPPRSPNLARYGRCAPSDSVVRRRRLRLARDRLDLAHRPPQRRGHRPRPREYRRRDDAAVARAAGGGRGGREHGRGGQSGAGLEPGASLLAAFFMPSRR